MSDFRAFKPLTITDANMTTSVYETPPDAYDAGDTYALADHVSVYTGTTATIYKSLQAGNIGNTPASSPAWWVEVGTAYKLWNAVDAFSVGDIVTDVASHKLYKSSQAGTNKPVTDTDFWFEYGDSNAWKMFGALTANQTEWFEQIEVTITATSVVTCITFFELDAASLQIIVNDGSTDVYDETISLVNNDGIFDYYEYFFNPIIYRRGYTVIEGLPNVDNPIITIRLNNPDATVKWGKVALGFALTFGKTTLGASFKNRDFSNIEENELGGDPIFVERTYRRLARFNVRLPENDKDYFYQIFSGYRATPVVIIANPNYAVGVVYGVPSFEVAVDSQTMDLVTLDVKGF